MNVLKVCKGLSRLSRFKLDTAYKNVQTHFPSQQEIMVGSMYQAETPAGLCKYKDNEKGELVFPLLTSAYLNVTLYKLWATQRYIDQIKCYW